MLGRAREVASERESEFLDRTHAAVDSAGCEDEQGSDSLCLDCELMPWSAKAQDLLWLQYAPAEAAANAGLLQTVSALADELGVHRPILYQWQRQMEHAGESSARATSPVRELRKQVREPKHLLAEKTLEVDFFKGALQKVAARRQSSTGSGGTASTTGSEK